MTEEKMDYLINSCLKIQNKREVVIRELAQIVGQMVASEPGVEYAPLFYKPLEQAKIQALKIVKGNFDGKMELRKFHHDCSKWWIENHKNSSKPIVRGNHNIVLKSDSSKTGWGGLVDNTDLKTGGHWSYVEQLRHINELELLAAFLTFKCFCAIKQNLHVRIYMDNTVAVQYHNMGGRNTYLNDLTREI